MNAAASAAILGYRSFLETRDGEPDPERDTLARREAFFRAVEEQPVRSRHGFDRAVFLRNVARARPEPGLEPRLLWLLATAKVNQSERFGVELGKLYGVSLGEDAPPEQVHVILQETYHTRTLADVVAIFGLPVPRRPPPRLVRLFIELMVSWPLPERMLLPVVGLSERIGCIVFRLLREKGLELFADEPEVAERIRLLYDDILADEICHVGLIEARLGRCGRALLEVLYRAFAPRMVRSMSPEACAVLGRAALARAFHAPFDQARLAAAFPQTAYAFSGPVPGAAG
jgi:hypothetical protein